MSEDPHLSYKAYNQLYIHIAQNGEYQCGNFTANVNFAGVDGRIDIYDTPYKKVCAIEAPGVLNVEYPESSDTLLMQRINELFNHLEQQLGASHV